MENHLQNETYRIANLNKISAKGLNLFTDRYQTGADPDKADAILVRSQDMHRMPLSDNLLAIARAGAGVNNIPVQACSEKGVVVFNTPGANANAVKELILSTLLMASRNLISAVEWTRTLTTDIATAVEKNKSHFVGEEIKGKVLAVIGLGYIGVMVANAAKELGMRVVGYDPYISVKSAHELLPSVRLYDSLETLLPNCDFVTVHVPATEETKGMISYELLDAMKNKAVLLNFARDSLVNSADLLRALSEKKLRLYITDFPTDALVGVENVIMVPHLGASTKESEENCAIMAVEQLMNYIEHGIIENSVNYPTCTPGVKTSKMRILVMNKNIPAILGKLTGALAARNVNINKLVNKSKGDNAYTVIDVDELVDAGEIRQAFDFDGVVSVRVI